MLYKMMVKLAMRSEGALAGLACEKRHTGLLLPQDTFSVREFAQVLRGRVALGV